MMSMCIRQQGVRGVLPLMRLFGDKVGSILKQVA